MLDELLGINTATVVVPKDRNPVLMPWIDKAPAVLEAVTKSLTNTGPVSGAEVVQAISASRATGQPPKRLAGFAKVSLDPNLTDNSATKATGVPRARSRLLGVRACQCFRQPPRLIGLKSADVEGRRAVPAAPSSVPKGPVGTQAVGTS